VFLDEVLVGSCRAPALVVLMVQMRRMLDCLCLQAATMLLVGVVVVGQSLVKTWK
jgi:hypothetical protein